MLMLRELADDSAGVPCCQNLVWHVTGDNAARSNHRSITDGDTWADDGTTCDPNVRPDGNGFRKFKPFASDFRFDRMSGRINLNGWTKEHITPDCDLHYIEDHTVKVEEDFASQLNIRAVIAEKRWLYPGICFGDQKLGQYSPALLLLIFMAIVKLFAKIATTLALTTEVGIQRVIKLTCEHFFFLGPHS